MWLLDDTIHLIDEEVWTSRLIVNINRATVSDDIDGLQDTYDGIKDDLKSIEECFPCIYGVESDNKKSVNKICIAINKIDDRIGIPELNEFAYWRGLNEQPDFTGIMKGCAIFWIHERIKLIEQKGWNGARSYTISFGDDVMTVNRPCEFTPSIQTKKKILYKTREGCCFSSGNVGWKRGDHIKVNNKHDFAQITVMTNRIDPMYCDYWATRIYSNISLAEYFDGRVIGIRYDQSHEILKDKELI